MRGPVVLARTSMLEDTGLNVLIDLSEPLTIFPEDGHPDHIWMQYRLMQPDGRVVPLIDYSSTGRIYKKPQDPNAIKEMLVNRVPTTQKVWHQVAFP